MKKLKLPIERISATKVAICHQRNKFSRWIFHYKRARREWGGGGELKARG